MTDEKRLAMLKWRDGIVDLVLDTELRIFYYPRNGFGSRPFMRRPLQ